MAIGKVRTSIIFSPKGTSTIGPADRTNFQPLRRLIPHTQSRTQSRTQSPFKTKCVNIRPPLIERFTASAREVRMAYQIGDPGDGGMNPEPYWSHLNAMWHFGTDSLAQKSCAKLWKWFLYYHYYGDFIGMDMVRKFIELGTMCATYMEDLRHGRTRYGVEAGQGEMGAVRKCGELTSDAALIFREALDQLQSHPGYLKSREEFIEEQKRWICAAPREAESQALRQGEVSVSGAGTEQLGAKGGQEGAVMDRTADAVFLVHDQNMGK